MRNYILLTAILLLTAVSGGSALAVDSHTGHKFGRAEDVNMFGAKIYDSTGPLHLGGTCASARSLVTGDTVNCGAYENQGITWNVSGQVKDARLASVALNWNITTLQPLYTCPTGKTCYVSAIHYKGASGTSATASCGVGWDAGGSNVLAASTNAITALTSVRKLPTVPATTGLSTNSLGFKCGTPEGSAFTATVDVYGFAE